MKTIYLSIYILLLQLPLFAINFGNLTVEQSLQKAKEQNKKVYVFFSSDKCMACSMMKNGVFKDELVSEMVDKNLIAVIVPMELVSLANNWKKEYDVKKLPTCLILDDDGDEMSRYEGGMGTAMFKEFINNAISGSGITSQKSEQPKSDNDGLPSLEKKPETVVTHQKNPEVKTSPTVAPTVSAAKPVHQSNNDKVNTKGTVSNSTASENHKNTVYYIQFGAFATNSKATLHQSNISKKFTEPTMIITQGSDTKAMYKLISEKIYSRQEAEKMVKLLKSKGLDCFYKAN